MAAQPRRHTLLGVGFLALAVERTGQATSQGNRNDPQRVQSPVPMVSGRFLFLFFFSRERKRLRLGRRDHSGGCPYCLKDRNAIHGGARKSARAQLYPHWYQSSKATMFYGMRVPFVPVQPLEGEDEGQQLPARIRATASSPVYKLRRSSARPAATWISVGRRNRKYQDALRLERYDAAR